MQEFALFTVAAAILAFAWVLLRRDQARRTNRATLLESIEKVAEGASTCHDVLALAESTLRPLTTSFSPADGVLALWTIDPPREGRLEGHTPVRWQPFSIPPEVVDYIGRLESAIRIEDLEARVVREPALRPVVLHLRQRGVALFVPAVAGGEGQGALLVPPLMTAVAMDDEIVAAFDQAVRWIAPQLAHYSALARASDREAAFVVERREMRGALEREKERSRAATAHGPSTFVARSAAMQSCLRRIDEIAQSSAPILLEASAGSGVGRVARAIHAASPFGEGRLVVRAARRLRAAELRPDGVAAGGTLLVRDVSGIPDSHVEPMLAAIERRGYRLVASTRVDLVPLVSDGRFDGRLWESLMPRRIRVPSLAERIEDLAEIATLRLRDEALALARPELRLSAEALAWILHHPWPGNVSELDLRLREAARRARGPLVEVADLDPRGSTTTPEPTDAPEERRVRNETTEN